MADGVLRGCCASPQVARSPQEKALHASAHLRTPPASAKKALRFPSPARVPGVGRHGQAQQAAAAAAQATSRVISGFGQVAARLGMSGFFGSAPAGSKPAGTQKAHAAAAADASLRAGNLRNRHIVSMPLSLVPLKPYAAMVELALQLGHPLGIKLILPCRCWTWRSKRDGKGRATEEQWEEGRTCQPAFPAQDLSSSA